MFEKLIGTTHAGATASRSHKERHASIKARAAKIEDEGRSEAAAFRTKAGEVETRYRDVLVGLEQAGVERTRALVAELVTDTRKALTDDVREWMRDPNRPVATRIAASVRAMIEREADEVPVGNTSSRVPQVLAFVMADALLAQYPLALFGVLGTERYGEALGAVQRAVNAPHAFSEALEQLEDRLTEVAQRALNIDEQGRARAAQRWQIVRQCDPRALEEFDGAARREQQSEFERTYQGSPDLPSRKAGTTRTINTGIQPGDPLARYVAPGG